jgi:hypothetical protein
MTLAASMLNNIFPLHTKTRHYHVMYPNVPNVTVCEQFSLKELLNLMKSIMLAISRRDTLTSLGIYFRPLHK